MSDPTLAEVADKTVDHIANGVQQIAGVVERLAPVAWEVAVRQQRTEGIADLITAVVLAVAIRVLWPVWRRWSDDIDDFERGLAKAFGAGTFILAALVAFAFARDGLMELQNPEFYAAQAIVSAVRK